MRSTQDLMDELGVSRRTLFRDLKSLELAGIPYYHKAGEGFRLAQGFFLPPVQLTVPETLGLMILAKLLAVERHRPLATQTLTAIQKLTCMVPQDIRTACESLMAGVMVSPSPQWLGEQEHKQFTALQAAIDEGRACQFTYRRTPGEAPTQGTLEPLALYFCESAWRLMARPAGKKTIEIYHVNRFVSVSPTNRLFRAGHRWTASAHLGKAWRLQPEGKVYAIEVEFSALAAPAVGELRWHSTQRLRWLQDGRCRMSFEVDGLEEFADWLGRFGEEAVVLAPPALRKIMQERFLRAASAYDLNTGRTGKSSTVARLSRRKALMN